MFKNRQISTDAIVFSQWSRKSYAVFASLKKVVRIASLSIDISQLSLLKLPVVICLNTLLGIDDSENNETDIKELQDNSQLLLAIMPIISTNKEIYSQKIIISYNTESPYFAQCKVWTFFF